MTKVTEQRNSLSNNIDILDTINILELINSEDSKLHLAIKKEIKIINKIVKNIINSFENDGRLLYVGAGTSGRIGVLDASECPPTFKASSNMVQGIIAGGKKALYKSVEGAEDSFQDGENSIKNIKIDSNDSIIGISASGDAPFVLGALKKSSQLGAYTALITFNNKRKEKYINDLLSVIVGPEIISGSTRMKAGTATKMILNMISTTSMIKSNKIYKNYMVDLKVTNNKLENRAINIISDLTGLNNKKAKQILVSAHNNVKASLVMNHLSIDYKKALFELKKNNGNLRKILD